MSIMNEKIGLSIAALDLGQRGVISQVAGEERLRRRLLEMGLVPGTEIHLIRRAPLGDPLEIGVRGYRLSLRRAEAALVGLH